MPWTTPPAARHSALNASRTRPGVRMTRSLGRGGRRTRPLQGLEGSRVEEQLGVADEPAVEAHHFRRPTNTDRCLANKVVDEHRPVTRHELPADLQSLQHWENPSRRPVLDSIVEWGMTGVHEEILGIHSHPMYTRS